MVLRFPDNNSIVWVPYFLIPSSILNCYLVIFFAIIILTYTYEIYFHPLLKYPSLDLKFLSRKQPPPHLTMINLKEIKFNPCQIRMTNIHQEQRNKITCTPSQNVKFPNKFIIMDVNYNRN